MTFKKGDPRINRKGRPKSFDKLRDLAQSIVQEPATGKGELVKIRVPAIRDGKPVLDENGALVMEDHYATNAEMVLRQWLTDPKRQIQLMEIAFGKVPQAVDLTTRTATPVITPSDMATARATALEYDNSDEQKPTA